MLRIPELRKREGVRYAVTDDGVELPVIDLTHPAFQGEPDEAELARLTERSLHEMRRFERLPPPARWLLMSLFSRGVLTREIRRARGTYLSGMGTYLLKLPPELLGAYARRFDRTVVRTLPCVSVRLRLQRVAHLLAEAVAARLRPGSARPLHLWNIGGGPAPDSLNTLLLLRRDRPELLERPLRVEVLDVDDAGPRFAGRALDALRTPDAPLAGLDTELRHLAYDWRDPARLPVAGDGEAAPLVACSSEGGLFEYGSDPDILANLRALRDRTAPDSVMVGTICRADGPAAEMNRRSRAALHLRTLEAFSELARTAGWQVTRTAPVPLAWCVLLERA